MPVTVETPLQHQHAPAEQQESIPRTPGYLDTRKAQIPDFLDCSGGVTAFRPAKRAQPPVRLRLECAKLRHVGEAGQKRKQVPELVPLWTNSAASSSWSAWRRENVLQQGLRSVQQTPSDSVPVFAEGTFAERPHALLEYTGAAGQDSPTRSAPRSCSHSKMS